MNIIEKIKWFFQKRKIEKKLIQFISQKIYEEKKNHINDILINIDFVKILKKENLDDKKLNEFLYYFLDKYIEIYNINPVNTTKIVEDIISLYKLTK